MTDELAEIELDPIIREIKPKPGRTGVPPRDLIQKVLDVVSNLLFIENIDDLLEEIARTVRELFLIEQVTIWLADEDGTRRLRIAQGFSEEKQNELRGLTFSDEEINKAKKEANWLSKISWFVPAEITIALGVDKRDKILFMSDPNAPIEPRKKSDDWCELDYLDISFLSREGKYVGALEIDKPMDNKIPSIETVRALEIFSSICSVAIELAELRDKEIAIADVAEGRASQISRILGFARKVLALEDPDRVVSHILTILQELFGFQGTSIILLDEKEKCYRYVAMAGYTPDEVEYAKTLRIPTEAIHFDILPEFLVGRNAYYLPAEELPDHRLIWEIYTPDSFDELKKKKNLPRTHPGAWHPLDNLLFVIQNRQGRVIGVLYVDKPRDGMIPRADTIDGVGIFASLVSVALENAKNYAETLRAKEEIELLNSLLFHDVSMLNTSMREYLELAMNPSTPKEQRIRYIRTTIQQLDGMVELIQKVRRLSSIQSIDTDSFVRLDLASVVRNQLSRAVTNFPDRKVRVVYEKMPDNSFVLANDLIGEMFNDILTNAIRNNYSENPEIVLSIKGLIDEFNNKNYWEVSIMDNGPGIPDEQKQLVFDISAQFSESRRADVSLFAVKSIVSLYGGSIWVDDRVSGDHSRGSVYHVLLPAG